MIVVDKNSDFALIPIDGRIKIVPLSVLESYDSDSLEAEHFVTPQCSCAVCNLADCTPHLSDMT